MSAHTPITDADLHAYVDGALEPARQREVEAWLATHPEAAASVARYREINDQLRALYDPVLAEPLPAQLQVRTRPLPWFGIAAGIACAAFGATLGWTLKPAPELALHATIEQQLARPAAFSHRVYTAEKLHPVEVRADQEKHLVEWLSRRLNTDLKAPNLAAHGFALVGGRLLPSTDRMAAQFMYENSGGTRVTLYVRRGAWENSESSFRYFESEDANAFYWVDGPLGYVLSGNLPRSELLVLSEAVYRGLPL
jgi:anti-sigma factor RsiW